MVNCADVDLPFDPDAHVRVWLNINFGGSSQEAGGFSWSKRMKVQPLCRLMKKSSLLPALEGLIACNLHVCLGSECVSGGGRGDDT